MLDLACTSQMAYKDDIVAEGKSEDTEIATANSDWKMQAKYGNIGLCSGIWYDKNQTDRCFLSVFLSVPNLRKKIMSVPGLVRKEQCVIFDN